MVTEVERHFVLRIFGLSLFSLDFQQSRQQADPDSKAPLTKPLSADTTGEGNDREPLFIINTLMLHECFKKLTKTASEDLHAVTGSVVDNIRSLERIVPLSLSIQNMAGAAADNRSLAIQLMRLNKFGLRPLAYFHSHPGRGISATQPSITDRETQSLMEQSGSEIIGGIFSRDGFVRFYANKSEPNVHVVGKQIIKVNNNVYRLEAEEDIQK